jgi:hypothetical protein
VQATAAVFQPDFGLPTVVAERRSQSLRERMTRLWARLVVGPSAAADVAREAREQAANAVAEIQVLAHVFVTSRSGQELEADLVDEWLGAKPYQDAYLAFYRAARSLPARTRPSRKKSEAVFPQSVLEDDQTRERLRFIDCLIEQVDATSETLASRASELPRFVVETPESEQEKKLLWFVYDPGIPTEIAEALLGLHRSEAAFVLLQAASDYWSPSVLRALSVVWADEYEKYARYIAGLPFARVTLIPEEQKVRVAELADKQRRVLEHLRTEGDKAIAELGR